MMKSTVWSLVALACMLMNSNAVVIQEQDSLLLNSNSKTADLCSESKSRAAGYAESKEVPLKAQRASYILSLKPRGSGDESYKFLSQGQLADGACQAISIDDTKFPGLNPFVTIVVVNSNGYAGYAYSSEGGLRLNITSVRLFNIPLDGFQETREGSGYTIAGTPEALYTTKLTINCVDCSKSSPNVNPSFKETDTPTPSGCDSGLTLKATLLAVVLFAFTLFN